MGISIIGQREAGLGRSWAAMQLQHWPQLIMKGAVQLGQSLSCFEWKQRGQVFAYSSPINQSLEADQSAWRGITVSLAAPFNWAVPREALS